MTLKRKGAPDDSPWHLGHMDLCDPNLKTKKYGESSICLDSKFKNQSCHEGKEYCSELPGHEKYNYL